MFEKDLHITFLLDFYGDILTEKRKTALDLYYNEDLSLAEVAEEMGITRQGARDLIKNAEDELNFFEEKLGLARKFDDAEQVANQITKQLKEEQLSPSLKENIVQLIDIITK